MIEKLTELLQNASSNYYHYNVASIVVTNDGKEFVGVNVETSSPAAGICAERNAVFSAIAHGYKKGDFKELHVMVNSDEGAEPCFICRQALVDFADSNMPIYLYTKNGLNKELTVKDLTPYPFDSEDMQ